LFLRSFTLAKELQPHCPVVFILFSFNHFNIQQFMLQTAEDIRQINEKIQYSGAFIDRLRDEVGRVIVGQQYMLDRLLIGLLSNGHVLLEGVPDWQKPWQLNLSPRQSMQGSAVSSLLQTCCRQT
jgi:hypothetical protein